MAKLRNGIDTNSTIGQEFLSSLETIPDGLTNYGILETFISCWVECMSEVITDILKDSMHMDDLGLKHRPGENIDALKRMFQHQIRGNNIRWEYTISPCTGSQMRLRGFFDK